MSHGLGFCRVSLFGVLGFRVLEFRVFRGWPEDPKEPPDDSLPHPSKNSPPSEKECSQHTTVRLGGDTNPKPYTLDLQL